MFLSLSYFLRRFLSFALRIPTAHDFPLPRTKLDNEINARQFLLNEHGDPHFLFYQFNENNILNNLEEIGKNPWLLF